MAGDGRATDIGVGVPAARVVDGSAVAGADGDRAILPWGHPGSGKTSGSRFTMRIKPGNGDAPKTGARP